MGTDKVCFPRSDDADLCADDVEFMAVTYYKGWAEQRDGLLGLAPVDESTGPSFVQNLYDQGLIQSQVATLWLNQKDDESTLTFGGIPEDSIDGFTYRSHKLRKFYDDWWHEEVWVLDLGDIVYNGKSIKVSNVTNAVLNSNTPFIYLEKQDFDEFAKELQDNVPEIECFTHDPEYCVSMDQTCDEFDDKLENIEFEIDGSFYVIPPAGYTESNGHLGYGCMIFVSRRFDV